MIDDNKENLGLVLQKNTVSAELLPEIMENEVHLWCLPLKLETHQHKIAIELLSDQQHKTYQRRKTEALKTVYLAGRYYLWHLLSAYSGQTIADLELKYNRLNKPFLYPNPKQLYFNFTDTFIDEDKALGIFAFGLKKELGVDLECLTREADFVRIANRRFSPAEKDYVNDPSGHQSHRFLKLWTRKEAYGKAKGIGINFSMREVDLFSSTHELSFQCEQQRDWRLVQISPNDQTIACVVREGNTPFKCQLFTELLT